MQTQRKAHLPSDADRAMPIDYSKFDQIDDSDDEVARGSSTAKAAKADEAPAPTCANCMKAITSRVLRCTMCKKANYCSQECQRGDWQFHKRVCVKPELATKKQGGEGPRQPRKMPKKDDETMVVQDEDVGSWYKHREWKPAVKQEFAPEKVDVVDVVDGNDRKAGTAGNMEGSAWNVAGTWEETDHTEWGRARLKELLVGIKGELPGGTRALEVEKVDDFSGDVSVGIIRGTKRYIFDLAFSIGVVARWMESSGQQTMNCKIRVTEFSDQTARDFVPSSGFPCEVSVKDQILRSALVDPLGFQAEIFKKMLIWVSEFHERG